MLVIFKLIEAGARRRKQHHVARGGGFERLAHSTFQRARADDRRGILHVRGNLVRGGADQVNALHPLAQQWVQHCVVAAFIFAAQNDVDVRGKRLQRFHRGVNVGRFGVVIERDAVDGRHQFEPVFDGAKFFHRLTHLLRRAACNHGYGDRRQHILQVVFAFELNIRSAEHRLFLAVLAEDDLIILSERAIFHTLLAAEPQEARFDLVFILQRDARRIVSIQHRKICRALLLKYPSFGVYIRFERMVAIKMVRRNVQDGGNPRAELLDAFQLEAGNFQHHHRVGRRLSGQRYHGSSNVAAHQRFLSALGQYLADERRRGGLAVGAGNRQYLAFQETESQLNFADHWDSQRARVLQLRLVRWNARAHHNQVLVTKGTLAVASGLNRNASIQQCRHFALQLCLSLGIGNNNFGAVLLQKNCRRHAGAPQSHHQNPFVLQLHRFFSRVLLHCAMNLSLQDDQSVCFSHDGLLFGFPAWISGAAVSSRNGLEDSGVRPRPNLSISQKCLRGTPCILRHDKCQGTSFNRGNGDSGPRSASVRLRGIIRFSLLHRFLPAPAQNKRTPPPPLHPLVNLLPEAPEVIDSRNQRDGHHEPNSHSRHKVYVQNEREHSQIEIPRVPAQGQNRGHHGDNLHHHFQLAQFAGFNGKAFRCTYPPQSADQKFSADNQHHHPYIHDVRAEAQQGDIAGVNHQGVRERVQQHAHGGDLPAAPRQVSIQAVGNRSQDEDAGRQHHPQRLFLRTFGAEIRRSKDPYDQRDSGNPRKRNVVRQVHREMGTQAFGCPDYPWIWASRQTYVWAISCRSPSPGSEYIAPAGVWHSPLICSPLRRGSPHRWQRSFQNWWWRQ